MSQPSELAAPPLRRARGLQQLRLLALSLAALALLAFALRGVPFASVWQALSRLSLWQIGALLLINIFVVLAITLRWWLVVRAEKHRLPFLPFIACRLAVFGVSYFTPGPQVGGEPLQALFLRREHRQTLARAVSTVILDKLLELLGNFLFIGLGLFGFLQMGASLPSWAGIFLGLLMVWPPVHILRLWRGRQPVSSALKLLPRHLHRQKWFRLVVVSEYLAAAFTRRHPGYLLAALGASLLAWAGMAAEYLLILSSLQIHPGIWPALSALTASLLAFLMPLPGGLGALEASQVLALGSLGYPAALAISVTLLMRLRDLLNAGTGIFLAARLLHR